MVNKYTKRVGIYLVLVDSKDDLNKDILAEMRGLFKSENVVLLLEYTTEMYSEPEELSKKEGLLVNNTIGYNWKSIPFLD